MHFCSQELNTSTAEGELCWLLESFMSDKHITTIFLFYCIIIIIMICAVINLVLLKKSPCTCPRLLGCNLLKSWNFPSDRNVFVIHGGPLRPHHMVYNNKVSNDPM